LADIIALVLGYYEIDKFKHTKTDSYYQTLSKLIKIERVNIESG
jgi:hypothetical protein